MTSCSPPLVGWIVLPPLDTGSIPFLPSWAAAASHRDPRTEVPGPRITSSNFRKPRRPSAEELVAPQNVPHPVAARPLLWVAVYRRPSRRSAPRHAVRARLPAARWTPDPRLEDVSQLAESMASPAAKVEPLSVIVPGSSEATPPTLNRHRPDHFDPARTTVGTDWTPSTLPDMHHERRPDMSPGALPAQLRSCSTVRGRETPTSSLGRHHLHDCDAQRGETVSATDPARGAPAAANDGIGNRPPLVTFFTSPAEL
jgi:hypothetical protein